jgi:hypothetical protein
LNLATLSPEELEAIKDEPTSPEDLKALQDIAGADDDTDEDDDGGDPNEVLDADGNPVAVAPAAVAPGTEPAASAADPVTAAAPAPAPSPIKSEYVAKLPDDFEAKLTSVNEQEDAIWAKFETGDIAKEDMQRELRALESQRTELSALKLKAEISQEMSAQSAQATWQNQINSFMAEAAKPASGGVDYKTDTVKAADLDVFVKTLAQKPENADKSGEWFLQEAHKRVMALYDIKPAGAAPTPKPAPAPRTNPLAAAPKTLAQVPGGDGPGDVGGEFVHLDALDGTALEDALKALSPAAQADIQTDS